MVVYLLGLSVMQQVPMASTTRVVQKTASSVATAATGTSIMARPVTTDGKTTVLLETHALGTALRLSVTTPVAMALSSQERTVITAVPTAKTAILVPRNANGQHQNAAMESPNTPRSAMTLI